jgi:3-oxoacyl-[acyl-carrier protein] reductase
MRFEGKVALITGAGRNIGAAIARAFGAEGANVAVIDINGPSAHETARNIQAGGRKTRAWALDVGDSSAVAKIVNEVREHFGTIHILVNNAALISRAIGISHTVIEMSEELWDQFFRVNIKGAFLMSREVARIMINDGVRGRIINITSGSAETARIGDGAYCCTKAALAMFTRVLAMELAPHTITVNSVSPGLIQYPQEEPLTPARRKYVEAMLQGIPLKRCGTPEEVARAVLFLAEDQSEYITATSVAVNGGSLAGRATVPKCA